MESLLQDLRYGARILWKTKGLALVAVASLAVGIGTNAAIFTLVNSILLRPRPVAQPEQLVELYAATGKRPTRASPIPATSSCASATRCSAASPRTESAGSSTSAVRTRSSRSGVKRFPEITSQVLGVRPHLGRFFLPEEESVPGRNPVVVIGFGLWQRKFDSDPGILGKTVTINKQALTVVGIAPPEYTGMMTGWSSEVFVPTMMIPLLDPSKGERMITSRGNKWVTMIGRLKAGTNLEQARSHFAVLTKELQTAHPGEWIRRRDDNTVREHFIPSLRSARRGFIPPCARPCTRSLRCCS